MKETTKETTPSMYNIKKISYKTKDEYRFYSQPIVTSKPSSSTRKRYIEVGGKEIDATTGKERSKESIEHSRTTSLNRTRQKVYDYILANDWANGLFITFTFNPAYVDSTNYDDCYARIKQLIKTLKKRNPDLQYLFIPEKHKSDRWHFHALLSNCPNLTLIDTGKTDKGMKIYNVNPRTFKYGYTEATYIQNIDKLCTYLTKHITTDLINHTKGKHRYIASDNLQLPVVETLILDDENLDIELEITVNDDNLLSVSNYEKVGNTITYINIKK